MGPGPCDLVHGTWSMGWSMVVHGPGPWGGPWTSVHVLYTSRKWSLQRRSCYAEVGCTMTPVYFLESQHFQLLKIQNTETKQNQIPITYVLDQVSWPCQINNGVLYTLFVSHWWTGPYKWTCERSHIWTTTVYFGSLQCILMATVIVDSLK